MEENTEEVQSLVSKTLVIVQRIEQRAKMFGNSMLILSILDCTFGLLAILLSSLTLVAFFASASSLTAVVIGGRIIQISKIRQLEKSLRPVNVVALAWFVNRYKKLFKKKGE